MLFSEAIDLWSSNEGFRDFYSQLLRESPFEAYRWETPALTQGSVDRECEFVLVRCNDLIRTADRRAFENKFAVDAGVVFFENLSGDATLVVPCPTTEDTAYAHLADFLRVAPESQQHDLFQAVGRAMQARLSDKPVWLSTAGMGVAWLHVRLDSRPKYYAHAPYKSAR